MALTVQEAMVQSLNQCKGPLGSTHFNTFDTFSGNVGPGVRGRDEGQCLWGNIVASSRVISYLQLAQS